MSRLNSVHPETATGRPKELLATVKRNLGMVPNMTRAMANAPAVLDAYLQFSGALAKSELSPKVRQQIALAVAEANGCNYCLAAHNTIGKMVGLTADQIRDSRLGTAVDARTNTLVRFARQVVTARGRVTESDLAAMRAAGWDDGAIAEVVANVAVHVFTNYFNLVADTEIDFPTVEPLPQETVAA